MKRLLLIGAIFGTLIIAGAHPGPSAAAGHNVNCGLTCGG